MLQQQTILSPDPAAIRADLQFMTRRWHELPEPAMFEVRCFKDGAPTVFKYAPDWIDDAVEQIADMNARGRNCYAVRNPIRASHSGSASDKDILAACYLWADCDDLVAAGNVHRFDGPRWTAAVTTGTKPHVRAHVYWELETPCTELAEWAAMQRAIAAHFKSDSTVVNPSRIMRIGGTVSWPPQRKIDKGYVPELTTLRTSYDDPRAPVSLDQMRRVFAAAAPALPLSQAATPSPRFEIDTGEQQLALDRERLAVQALSGVEWHNAVIRLVASYVGRGLTDAEIHALTQPLTLAGYTPQQTAQEVQQAIDGARRKGWTPAAPPAPNFDHAPAPTPSDPTPQASAWRVQTAADFTADFVAPEYIVDGIVQRGRVYTLTAPTGSGKTAAMLYAATCLATGSQFCCREVEQGDVLFMAGENPDDVRARTIATMEFHKINPANCRLHFIAGTFSIRADLERLREEAARLPDLKLVVIDTFAAYFDGDDENSNVQALDFARLVRKIAAFPSKPAVIMPAHPVKNARRDNLSPKGGSSLLNEVDGNLTLWNEGGILSMHWQGKFRGAEFEPLSMELHRFESAKICDSDGRLIPTILAKPLSEPRAMEIATENLTLEDRTLLSIDSAPAISIAERCVQIGMTLSSGKAHKSRMVRILNKLADQKLVRRFRTNWELTKDGERAVEMLRSGQSFAKEI